jgi:hypothetical protein
VTLPRFGMIHDSWWASEGPNQRSRAPQRPGPTRLTTAASALPVPAVPRRASTSPAVRRPAPVDGLAPPQCERVADPAPHGRPKRPSLTLALRALQAHSFPPTGRKDLTEI